MAPEFLSSSDPIPRITVGIIDQSEFVSAKIEHFDPGPAILIAAAGVKLEPNESNPRAAKLPSISAATAKPGVCRHQTTSRDKWSFRDHGIPLKIRDGCDVAVKSASIKTRNKCTRADGEKRTPTILRVCRVVIDIVAELENFTRDQPEALDSKTGEFRVNQPAVVNFSFR